MLESLGASALKTRILFWRGSMINKYKYLCVILVSAWILVCPRFLAPAFAENLVCESEVCFAKVAQVGDRSLPLLGVSLMRYYGFRLYVAALYADPAHASTQAIVGTVPKKLVLHYLREFSSNDFITSGLKFMKKNPAFNLETLAAPIDQMDKLYLPVVEGDRYSLSFLPGQGGVEGQTSLQLNEKLLGSVKGDAFQAAYFGIWLSEYSAKEAFTKKLFSLEKTS